MFFHRRYRSDTTEEQTSDEKNEVKLFDNCGTRVRLLVIVLAAIALSAINSLELVYFNFGATFFQYIRAGFTAPEAATVSSAMAITYTCSQVINFLLAFRINTNRLIVFHYVITVAAIVALVFAQNSQLAIWILAILVGYGFSLIYPGVLAFVNTKVNISNRVGTIIWFIAGSFNFFPPLIIGPYIETFPMIFVIIQLVYLLFSVLCLLFIVYLVKKYSKLNSSQEHILAR